MDVAGPQFRREAVAFALEQQQWVITGGLEVSASGRVLDEHLGLSALMERHLTDSGRGKNVQLPVPDLYGSRYTADWRDARTQAPGIPAGRSRAAAGRDYPREIEVARHVFLTVSRGLSLDSAGPGPVVHGVLGERFQEFTVAESPQAVERLGRSRNRRRCTGMAGSAGIGGRRTDASLQVVRITAALLAG